MQTSTTQPAAVTEETPGTEPTFAPDGVYADPEFWQGYAEWVDDCARMRDALTFGEAELIHDGRQG
jgi:hypothetical protein